ncbi:hypothetical protein PsorP6_015433 [Peronosclerospora sorghi]|uniref:Uncharacterized protein n=1 Tax=Peronosclerospora sorghi TaxID=230839 RepID=A0ACC0WP65_9STRA|nr:hypothetical protein PsorP6_015433 [Peronosclerospora sorghi]
MTTRAMFMDCRSSTSAKRFKRPVRHANGFTVDGGTFNVDTRYDPIRAIVQGSYGVLCSVRNTETNEMLAFKTILPMAGDEWDATHTLYGKSDS